MSRVIPPAVLAAGLMAQATPAEAAVICEFDEATATLTLEKRDGVTIGRDLAGRIVVSDVSGKPVDCGADVTVENVENVVIGVDPEDNDDEQVTIDMTNGLFVHPNDPDGMPDVHFAIDLGDRGVDGLVIEGLNNLEDSAEPAVNDDHIKVTGTDIDLNGNDRVDVATTDVESLEVRGNAGYDEIDAQGASFGPSVPSILSDEEPTPGLTLVGGDGNDTLIGSERDDKLIGKAGDDQLLGLGGNDTLDGGAGNDLLDGGAGNDTADFSSLAEPVDANLLRGTAVSGDDEDQLEGIENLIGTPFEDRLVGDDNDNIIDGNDGNDTIFGLAGRDRLNGQNGNDVVNGNRDEDDIDGEAGNDVLHGDEGGDDIDGGSGADVVHAGDSGSSEDVIEGGVGSDSLFGEDGKDRIIAGDGNDEAYGGEGDDKVFGDDGDDFVYGGEDDDKVFGGDGEDDVFGDGGDDLVSGGDGPDQVYGGQGNDKVLGGDGHDELYGDGGQDKLDGGAGNDSVFGGDDRDHLEGGDGADHVNGGDDRDLLNGQHGDDSLQGGEGIDTVSFAGSRFGVVASLAKGTASGDGHDTISEVENLWGSDHDDSLAGDNHRNGLRGRDGADTLNGGGRDDVLSGGFGRDVLAGGLGNDREYGDGGNDVLDQGPKRNGADALFGGAGRKDLVDYSERTRRVKVTRDNRPNDGERREHDNVHRDIERVRR